MYSYNLGLRFQAAVSQYADRPALCMGAGPCICYAELNALANRMARVLLGCEVGPGCVVAISGTKSLHTFATMLGCLKLGAAYCVLDPDSPVERLRKIVSTCRPKLLVSETDFAAKLDDLSTRLGVAHLDKNPDSLDARLIRQTDADLPETSLVTGSFPAYIMYTSGSTGFPKGAVMTHTNVLNLVEWSRETYAIIPEDILTNINPLYFDNSVFDFYSSLFNGACLVPFTKEEVRDPKVLVEKVDRARCSLWFSVPSLLIFLQTMKAANGKYLRTIRRFVFGGEGYPNAKLKKLYDTYKDTSEFHNVYGPTECTCICSSCRLEASDLENPTGLPPLGQIARNFGYLILGDDGRKVPEGEIGELCLLGPNVGKGYYNDPERTAASFVQNPCNDKFQEWMYKTGDLVRFNPADRRLYIHGRKDNQIKHMGYRIELEEIEAALHCLPYVSEAVAIHSKAGGSSRILAVVASRQELDPEQIRRDLKKIIPDYMIPAMFHQQSVLPKNPSGKVDRRALAAAYLPATDRRKECL